MAILSKGLYKIKVTPNFESAWWVFDFELLYNDQSFLNPAITKKTVFCADEYNNGEHDPEFMFITILVKALQSTQNGEVFGWSAWESEVEVEITTTNVDRVPKIYKVDVLIGEELFMEGETNIGPQNRGVMSVWGIDGDQLSRFLEDLKSEMAAIEKVLPKE